MNYPTYTRHFGLWPSQCEALTEIKGDADLALTVRAKYPQLGALLDELGTLTDGSSQKEGQILRVMLKRVGADE